MYVVILTSPYDLRDIVIGCVIISTTRTVGADALVKAQSFMSRCRKVISRDVATLESEEPAMASK